MSKTTPKNRSRTTSRDNLKKVLNHQKPDWIPVTGHVDPSHSLVDPDLAGLLGEVQWRDESIVKFSRFLGLDIMDWYGAPVRIRRRNVEITSERDGNTTINTWHTPEGELTETIVNFHHDDGSRSSNRMEHLVKKADDLHALAAVFEDEIIESDPELIEQTRRRRRLIGDDGLLMGTMPGTPLGMMYRVYSGVANLCYLWADAPDALHDLCDVMERNYQEQMRVAALSDIDVFVAVDDTSTTVISPAMFEEFNMDLTDRRAGIAHEHDKFYFHHSCGHIRDLLPLYRQTDMDAVHAFTVPPIGNVTVPEGRRILGPDIAIMAGLARIADSLKDIDAARSNIKRMIAESAPCDNLILNLGPGGRSLEQLRFLLQCCREADPLRR